MGGWTHEKRLSLIHISGRDTGCADARQCADGGQPARLARLNERWNSYALEKNKAYEGRVVKVLVDGPSKKNESAYSGYTETNKLVNFSAEGVAAGDIVEVRITQARTWSLHGELVSREK